MKHRDMSVDTREKLVSLFRAGHAPSSARNFLKMELLLNHPESYREKMLDAHFVPSISVVTHLYKTMIHEVDNDIVANSTTKVTARELKAMMGQANTQPVRVLKSRTTKKLRSTNSVPVDTVAEIADNEDSEHVEQIDQHSLGNGIPVAERCVNAVDEFCSRIKQGIADDPESFIPAIERMQHNLSVYATSESGLLTTLRTMGLPVKWNFNFTEV